MYTCKFDIVCVFMLFYFRFLGSLMYVFCLVLGDCITCTNAQSEQQNQTSCCAFEIELAENVILIAERCFWGILISC